jgi:hypothetical protein
MGQELLPPNKDNPRGYFEDIGFLEFQRRLLSECCLSDDGGHPDWGWTETEQLNRETFKDFIPAATSMLASRVERRGLWGWKDPRTTLLLDFWDTLLAAGRYILPLDADNRMRAGFIEGAIKVLDSSSEIGVVYGYRQFFGMNTDLNEVSELH